jgi:DHA2 family multidrug resistance protein
MSCYLRTHFNAEVDFVTIASIQLFMGIGISLFFMPMTTILLSDLSGPQVADAASLSTFARTLGASFASSLTAWFWTHDASLHHVFLSEHINPYNPLASAFMNGNATSSLLKVNNIITGQSYMLSTIDLFEILMWMFIVLIPFVFFTRRPRAASGAGGAAH